MKKNILSLAVAAALTGVVAGSAQAAMHINDKGTGEALVYPFYSTEGGNDTYIHVVNTTEYTKAVKVRFIEARNSQEVLDFNLYLSPEDEWAGVITASGAGAKIRTVDNSCTAPALGGPNGAFSGTQTNLGNGLIQRDQPFVNFKYNIAGEEERSISRTTEGYIEIIEMGQLDPTTGLGLAAVHDEDGVPNNCGNIVAAWNAGGTWTNSSGQAQLLPWGGEDGDAAGGLWGYGVVINVAEGTAVSYDAIAIDSFNDPVEPANLHFTPGNELPSLNEAQTLATIFDGAVANDYGFASGAEAVSALFMSANISNDYVVDEAINANTDWVVTMPTKRFFVQGANPTPPFTDTWDGSVACEPVDLSHWDREEAFVPPPNEGFSPRPPQVDDGFNLCTEVSIIQFGDESALNGSDSITYGFNPSYDAGWARLGFLAGDSGLTGANDRVLESDNGDFLGLPVVGFAAINYQNGVLGEGVLANYAASVKHKSEQAIDAPVSVVFTVE